MLFKENYTKPLRSLLKEGGLWLNFSKQKYGSHITAFQILRYIFCLTVWVLTCCTIFKNGVQFVFTPPGIFLPLGGVLMSATFIILLQSKKLEQLVDQCEINLSSYEREWEIDIVKSYCKKMAILLKFVKLGFIWFALLYIFFPLIVDGIRILLGYSEPYFLPMPLGGYLDKNPTRSSFYFLIIITCDIWFLEAITLTNAFEGYILFVVSYNIIEFKILKTCVQMLMKPEDSKEKDDGVLLLPPWNLERIIKYHRKIIRLNILQNKSMTLAYIVQNVSATLSFAFIMLLIRQVVGENNMVLFLSVTFIGMITVLLFYVCYAGELIQSESKELFESLYNTPWYRQSPRVRRDVLIMMTQLSKPLVLDYKSNVINLPAFMQMMNNSYSFFMLMNSVDST